MAVYWLGADGNIYLKGNKGVQNVGRPFNGNDSLKDQGFDSTMMSAGATRIADPNPPRQAAAAPQNPNGGGQAAAPAAPPKVDKSSSIALNNAGLAAVDQQLNSNVSAIDRSLNDLKGRYNAEATANEASYTENSNNNQNNLQKNKQTAYVNAAQGRQGLFGTLSSLGALSGSGIDLANRAVQKGANDDLSGAADNYSENQSGLDTSIGTFRREDEFRKKDADTRAADAKVNASNQASKDRLNFFGNLINDYSAMGDEANAKAFTAKASALYPALAETSRPNASLNYSSAAFTAPSLENYLAGADSTVVNATPTQPGQELPGLVAAPTKKRERQPA